MRFGPTPIADAAGAVLAHTLRVGDEVLKKGRRLSREDVGCLESLGITSVVCARLDPTDVAEDEAAVRIAQALAGEAVSVAEPFTGRANLHAGRRGLVDFEPAAIDRLNAVDEAVAVSTVALHAPVESGQMVCTVKIIPFAVDRTLLDRAVAAGARISVRGFRPARAGMISTRLPGVRESVVDRAVANMRARLERIGGRLEIERRSPHDETGIAEAIRHLVEGGCSPILILGASAIVDRGDVVPRSVVAAGGEILRLGIPVDPGNLLLLARIGGVPVLGVPGCARSLARSGFDQVLERLLAGIEVDATALSQMGSGGLLGEISTRPQPRAAPR
ncbi:MAG: molybdopterin-binding protein, partial [Candidatus Binatia bacterium]